MTNESIIEKLKSACLFVWFCGLILFFVEPFLNGNYYLALFTAVANGTGIVVIFFSYQPTLWRRVTHYLIPLLSACMLFITVNKMTGWFF